MASAPQPGGSFGAWFSQYQQQQQQEQEEGDEEQGLMGNVTSFLRKQGLGSAADGLGTAHTHVSGYANKFVASIRGEDGLVQNAKESVQATLNYTARFRAFLALLLIGVLFYVLAFFVGLPAIVLRPSKFALSVTFGSICTMGSFTALLGPKAHLQSLLQRDRALFSLAYIGSLVLTLYASIWARSYILTVVATAVQLGAFAWYAVANLPGGAAGLRVVQTVIVKSCMTGAAVCGRMMSCCVQSLVKM